MRASTSCPEPTRFLTRSLSVAERIGARAAGEPEPDDAGVPRCAERLGLGAEGAGPEARPRGSAEVDLGCPQRAHASRPALAGPSAAIWSVPAGKLSLAKRMAQATAGAKLVLDDCERALADLR